MGITKEDIQEVLKKAEGFKNELLGKDEDAAVRILTEKTGVGKEVAQKAFAAIKNIDLSKVDLSKIELPDIDFPDGIKNVFKK
jgi:hypothetical protein